MSLKERTHRTNSGRKELFPGAKFGLKSLREEKVMESKYYEVATTTSFTIATFLLIIIPYLHLDVVYSLWNQYSRAVNKSTCTCSCWDSTFKSNYEAGIPRYKHVYFNITSNSLKIWLITILSILLFYESIRKSCHLLVIGRLRLSMLILFISSLYPHYYSWWSFFNFLNDDYHYQWYHQSLFTFTELISTYFVIHLLDKNEETLPWKLILILTIAVTHCLISLTDQFGYNVIRGEGELHQLLRDVGFMLPDLLHVYVPVRELTFYAKRKYVSVFKLISNKLFAFSVCFVMFTWILSLVL